MGSEGRGLGRLWSTLDTFIFPESNSASDRARSRRGLFSTWKLERDKQVRLSRDSLESGDRVAGKWVQSYSAILAVRASSASLARLPFSQVACSSQQPSSFDLPAAPELDWTEPGQSLTFIGHQVQWRSRSEEGLRPRSTAVLLVSCTEHPVPSAGSFFLIHIYRHHCHTGLPYRTSVSTGPSNPASSLFPAAMDADP